MPEVTINTFNALEIYEILSEYMNNQNPVELKRAIDKLLDRGYVEIIEEEQ